MSDWEKVDDSGDWELIPEEAPQDFSLWDVPTGIGKKAASSVLDALAGLKLFEADRQQSEPASSFAPQLDPFALAKAGIVQEIGNTSPQVDRQDAQALKDLSQQLSSEVDQSLQGTMFQRPVDLLGSFAGPAALTFLNPALGAGAIGLQSAGQKYSQLDDVEGVTPYQKALDAGLTGLTNAGLSYIPLRGLGSATGSLPARFAKETARVGAFNALLNPVQTGANAFIDSRVAGQITPPEQLADQMSTSIGDAFITAPLFGAVGALGARRAGRPQDPLGDGAPVADALEEQFAANARRLAPEPVQDPAAQNFILVDSATAPNFTFRDPAPPPALRPDMSVALTPQGMDQAQGFSLTDPSYYSVLPERAPQGFVNGPDFIMRLGADQMQMAPAAPPALINNPVRDLMVPESPLLDAAALPSTPIRTDLQPQPRAEQPLVQPVEGFSSTRSARKTNSAAEALRKIEEERAATQRVIDETNRVQQTRPFTEIPIIKVDPERQSFADPSAKIAKAAEEGRAKEPPLIATPDDAPFTVKDRITAVASKIVTSFGDPKFERGAIATDLLGARAVDPDVAKAQKGDPVYNKYSKRGLFAARNWLAVDSIGKDVPQVKPLADAIQSMPEDASRALTSIQPDLMNLMRHQGDAKVEAILWRAEQEGGRAPITAESLSGLGLSESQARAVMASKNLQLKASEMLKAHQFDLTNRDYAVKVKGYQLEAPQRKIDLERQYQAELEQLRREAFDPTAIRQQEIALEEKFKADLAGVDTWLSESMSRAASERNSTLKAIDQRHAAWDDSNYLPRNRYGNLKVKAYDQDGQLYEDRQTDDPREATRWKKAYEKSGLKVTVEKVTPREQTEHFSGISDEVLTSMDPVGGFRKHMMKSRRIKGADTDPVRAWAEYFQGLSKKMALDRMEMRFKEAMLELPRDPNDPRQVDKNLSPVVKELLDRKDAVTSVKSGGWRMVSKLTDLTNLTFQLRTPLSNLFAIPQRQYPELGKYINDPARVIGRTFNISIDYMRMGDEAFAKKYGPLAEGIAVAASKRIVTPTAQGDSVWSRNRTTWEKQVNRLASNSSKLLSTADDVAFFLQYHSDRFAESSGFIAGWEAYPEAIKTFKKNGQPVPTRQQFAEQFAKDTKANVNPVLAPSWAQGPAQSTTLKYKAWQFRFLGALLDAANRGDKGYLARALGATVASAGARGLPFYKTVVGALTALGVNPEDKLQEWFEESGVEDRVTQATGVSPSATVIYGPLTSITGTNISGSVGFGDPLPDTSRGVEAAIGSVIGGPLAATARKAVELPGFVRRGQTDRAIESLPVSIPPVTNLARMYRMSKEGVVTKGGIGVLPKDEVTNKMLIEQMLGFGDLKTARAYDKYMAGARAGDEGKDAVGYPALIAEAYGRGDVQRAIDLTIEAAGKGVIIRNKDIQERVAKRAGEEDAILKKYPKRVRPDVAAARRLFD